DAYPRKKGKAAALKALGRVRKTLAVPWEQLIFAARRYAEQTKSTEPKYVKHPASWLNAGCWDDEPDREATVGKPESAILASLDETRERIRALGLRNSQGPPDARLLSQGGGERPADLRNGGSGHAGSIPGGGDRSGNEPAVRPAEPDGLHADAEGTEGGLRS